MNKSSSIQFDTGTLLTQRVTRTNLLTPEGVTIVRQTVGKRERVRANK